MALPASGVLSLDDIQTEFGGTNPIGMSEYYRGGSFVTDNNTSVPTSGEISVSDFYSTVKAKTVIYEVIGGGGGGAGGGISAGDGSAGTSSSLSGSGFTTITSTGGSGGTANRGFPFPDGSSPGDDSFYGAGGAGGTNSSGAQNVTDGQAPAATHYGAGGGSGGTQFQTGTSGYGGGESTRQNGTLYLVSGTVITVTIGGAGSGGTPGTDNDFNPLSSGGAGAGGYAKFTVDGVDQEFTSSGTYTVPA